MSTNEKTGAREIEQTLQDVLNVMIPPGRGGAIPGAADIGFAAFLRGENDYPSIQEGLVRLMNEALENHGKEFSALSPGEQAKLIERLKVKDFRFFGILSNQIIKYYYRNKGVLAAHGLEPRPPFPLGHNVHEGDLTLLEPVYERGRKYRE